MMLSLIFLSILLQPVIEKIIIHFLLFNENKGVLEMVKLNVKRHYHKNTQTHILFSLCLAFILFAQISVDNQV